MRNVDPNTIRPLADRLLVETILETSQGGVVMPEMIVHGRPHRARVLAVGPGARDSSGERIPMPFEVGDEVVFRRVTGTQIDQFNDRLIIFREEDILARFKEIATTTEEA